MGLFGETANRFSHIHSLRDVGKSISTILGENSDNTFQEKYDDTQKYVNALESEIHKEMADIEYKNNKH